MGRRCTICYHEARAEIENLVKGHVHHTDIAKRFGVSHFAVGRHSKKHMEHGALAQVKRDGIEPLGASGTPEQRLEVLFGKAEEILLRAERGASVDTQIRALAECRHQMELIAKIVGDLRDDTTVQILQITMPSD